MGAPRRSSRKGKGQHSQVEVPVNLVDTITTKNTKIPTTPKSKKTILGPVKKATKVAAGRGRPKKQPTTPKKQATPAPTPKKQPAPTPTPKKQAAPTPKKQATPTPKKQAPPVPTPTPKKQVAPTPKKLPAAKQRGRKSVAKKAVKAIAKKAVEKKSVGGESSLQLKQIKEIEAKAVAIETELRVQLKELQDNIKSLQKQIQK